jgi:hypothetical protein
MVLAWQICAVEEYLATASAFAVVKLLASVP